MAKGGGSEVVVKKRKSLFGVSVAALSTGYTIPSWLPHNALFPPGCADMPVPRCAASGWASASATSHSSLLFLSRSARQGREGDVLHSVAGASSRSEYGQCANGWEEGKGGEGER